MSRDVVAAIGRFLTFGGMAYLFGLLTVSLLVLRPGLAGLSGRAWRYGEERLARRALLGFDLAVAAVVVGTVGVLAVQVLNLRDLRGDGSLSAALTATVDTGFGRWTALRLPLVVALALVVRPSLRSRLITAGVPDPGERPWWGVWAGLAGVLLLTLPLGGHAAGSSTPVLAVADDALHLAAGATWITGVAFLGLVLPAALRGKRERVQVQLLAPMLMRFSRVAVVAVSVAALTGAVSSLLDLQSLGQLRSSGWGEALTVKLWLFAWILAFGGANHFVLVRRLSAAAADRKGSPQQAVVATSVAGEVLFGVLLLAATAVLTGQAPPR